MLACSSMKMPRPRVEPTKQRGVIDDSASDEMDDIALPLDYAVHRQQSRAQDLAPLRLEQARQTMTLT